MSGISLTGAAGASGLPRNYIAIAAGPLYTAPDDCIGFYAKSDGDVTFDTVEDETLLTFSLEAGDLFPAEVNHVTVWSGTAGDLYAAIR